MESATTFDFERTYATDVPELNESWSPAPVADPRLLAFNDELAAELGLDAIGLRTTGLAVLAGNDVPAGAEPVAQAYSGHQFGGFSPRLGDGRALMLGELLDPSGRRFDVQLKGSGRTPFARGGDGRAAVGPMLREYVFGEAMAALGVPTTRMLAVVATGETIRRERPLPGAVLTRIASSHLRVGTFQYAAATSDPDVLARLVDHAVRRHHAAALEHTDDEGGVALALLDEVIGTQIRTVARWMALGFVHGVLNTDNVTISGETIDYGPCAFMEAYDPATVFSSIDHGGRYAYGNQPTITAWNMARLAESLLTMISDDQDRAVELATELLESFPARFAEAWRSEVAAKLGLDAAALDATRDPEGARLDDRLLASFHAGGVDWTSGWRALGAALRGDPTVFAGLEGADDWLGEWFATIDASGRDRSVVADELDGVNPKFVVRNQAVEQALASASADADLGAFERLVEVVRRPFDEQPDADDLAGPAPDDAPRHVTFCGT